MIPRKTIMDIGDILTVSTTCFEDRLDDIFKLLYTKEGIGYIPNDEYFRLFILSQVSKDEVDKIHSDVLIDVIMQFNKICIGEELPPRLSLFVKDGEYHLRLVTYIYYNLVSTDTVITEDLAREFIEAFHEKFCDCNRTEILRFTGEYPSIVKPAKR